MNSKALATIQDFCRGRNYPSIEVLTDYIFERESDAIPASARYAVGITELTSDRLFVVHVSDSGVITDGKSAVFGQCPVGQKPHGIIEFLSGNYCLVRLLDLNSDLEDAAVTAGADYVVGTDGKLATVGDTNYPTLLESADPYVVGHGYVEGRVMLGFGPKDTRLQAVGIDAYSAAILANTPTLFDKYTTVNGTKLKVGQRIVTDFMIDFTAAVVNTTFLVYHTVGGVSVFAPLALDPLYTGDVVSGKIITEVRVLGASGKIVSWGHAKCRGEAADKRFMADGLRSETTLDTTSTAILCRTGGTFSAAGANSAILRSQRTRIE